MKTKIPLFVFLAFLFQQDLVASNLDITTYKFPFNADLIVKMRLVNICDENKSNELMEKRGIPSSSPEYKIVADIMKSQCAQARASHLQDSIAYDVRGKALNEVFSSSTSANVSMFNITLRQYDSINAFSVAWGKIQKSLKNTNKDNSDYILVNGAYNSASSYININNIIIQSDLMLSKGDTLETLNLFTQKYSTWLKK